MPVKFALTCAQCDAPLPPLTQQRGAFTCAHCGATTAFALSANEFALFTDGLRAEQGAQGAFTLSGLEQSLAARLDALTQQVERSVRLTERVHLPQLEQDLRAQRELLAATTREVEGLLAQIEVKRKAARDNRLGWFVASALLAAAFLASGTPDALWVPALMAVWGWLHNRGRLNKYARLAAQLVAETGPAINDQRAAVSENERIIAEIRRT